MAPWTSNGSAAILSHDHVHDRVHDDQGQTSPATLTGQKATMQSASGEYGAGMIGLALATRRLPVPSEGASLPVHLPVRVLHFPVNSCQQAHAQQNRMNKASLESH